MTPIRLGRTIYVLELERKNYSIVWMTQFEKTLTRHFNSELKDIKNKGRLMFNLEEKKRDISMNIDFIRLRSTENLGGLYESK